MQGNLWARPQGSHSQEMHQLMEWLQDEERDDHVSDDSEAAGHDADDDNDDDDDPLMQLAQEAATPAAPRSSQQVPVPACTGSLCTLKDI